MEKLADAGLAPTSMRGTRPFSITYVTQLVRRAGELAAKRGGPEPPILATARDLVERLQAHDLGPVRAGGTAEAAVGRQEQVITKSYTSFADRTGYLVEKAGAGAAPEEGLGLAVTGRTTAGRCAAAEAAGRFTFPGTGPGAELLRGYAKVGFGALELEAGRDDLVWGPGRYATMTLSGNARALDQLSLRTSRPVVLPWIFRYLGDVQGVIFVARLDQELPFKNPYLIGKRINVLLFPWLEVGVVHLFAFGGEGAPRYPASYFLQEFFLGYRTHVYTENFSNNAFSWDVRLKVKSWFELYWEHYFEDCCASLFTRDTSIMAGVRRPQLFSWRDDLALEFVLTTSIAYTHGNSAEFEQQGRVTGYPIGNSGLGAYALWRYLGDEGGLARLRLGMEQRRVPHPTDFPGQVDEWRVGGEFEGRLPLIGRRAGRVDALTRLILQRVFAAEHVPGNDRTAGLIEVGLAAVF